MLRRAIGIGLAAVISTGLAGYAVAGTPATKDVAVSTDFSAAAKKTTTVKRTTAVKRPGGTTVRRTTVKSTTVRRGAPAVRATTVRRNVVVVRRPYRAWVARPYYGAAIIGGVALGTVIAVSAAHAVPVAPGPNACWYWSDPTETRGYWDYCTPP